jgi:hypothetical protein
MTRIVFAAALALAVALPTVSAQAQSPRTFVSAAGSDSNPCTFAAPCRHFQAAVNVTSDGNEVDALDPAGYSPITISRGITIEGQGWSYIAPPPNGTAITINAGSNGDVYIHGVSLNGAGITGTTNGIELNTGGSLTVRDSVIRNFSGYGIYVGDINPLALLISNTLISDISSNTTPNGSVYIGGNVNGVFDHVEVENGLHEGILLDGENKIGQRRTHALQHDQPKTKTAEVRRPFQNSFRYFD